MTKTKHTPLPWKVYYAKNNGQLILGTGEESGQAIQSHNGAFWRDEAEAKANAEFVVKACNSHYELLEALESVKEYVHNFGESHLIEIVDKAIAKARGES